jgi:uncharacterized protein YutE (UPF0331/DUF86 family)
MATESMCVGCCAGDRGNVFSEVRPVVDQDALSSRLSALENYLAELRSIRGRSREEFVSEPALHHLAERLLQLACECVLDVVHHIIADLGLRQPTSYKDAIDVLREQGLLTDELGAQLKAWMGFRNVLVHFYLKIDHGRSYDAIVQDLSQLEEFTRSMAKLLEAGDG